MGENYQRYSQNKESIRNEKEEDKHQRENNPSFKAAVVVLGAVLPCPSVDLSLLFYKRKLSAYNFIVCMLSNNKVLYVVYETTAGRGTIDIASSV